MICGSLPIEMEGVKTASIVASNLYFEQKKLVNVFYSQKSKNAASKKKEMVKRVY